MKFFVFFSCCVKGAHSPGPRTLSMGIFPVHNVDSVILAQEDVSHWEQSNVVGFSFQWKKNVYFSSVRVFIYGLFLFFVFTLSVTGKNIYNYFMDLIFANHHINLWNCA